MRRLAVWAGLAAVVAASVALAMRPGPDNASGASEAASVAASLRCPVCQGLSVKDSDSPAARDIRADIRRRLDAGEEPAEVRQAYVDRYGEWVLLRPKSSGFEALVWGVPAAVVAGGFVVLAAVFWRWRAAGGRRPPTEDERRLVAAASVGSASASKSPS